MNAVLNRHHHHHQGGHHAAHHRRHKGCRGPLRGGFLGGLFIIIASVILACNAASRLAATDSAGDTPIPTVVIATLPPPTATPIPPTSTPLPTPTPFGCQQPSDDYTHVPLGPDIVLNQRTLSMLQWAQTLYGGSHDLVKAVTQGSYTPGYAASFGTHDGGGAVDVSVRDLKNFNHILYDDIPSIILALREAGFAAWLRQPGELGEDSPIHIHAIAVGDRDLSPAALRQLSGPEGYFRGFNGLPKDPPVPDADGPPILCPWMVELGYSDLRLTPTPMP